MIRVSVLLNSLTYCSAAVSYISVAKYLNGFYAGAFIPFLLLAIRLDHRRTVKIGRWVFNFVSISVLLISVSRITADFLVEPIVEAILSLVVVKLLDVKEFRDYMQIYALCMFLLVGSTLMSFSSVFVVYFSLLLVFLTVSLILLAHFARDPEMTISRRALGRVMQISILICAVAIPSSLLFFIILPRTSYPLFNFLNRKGIAQSGFTDNVELGKISEIQEDRHAVFRAQMDRVREEDLYWRGLVLDSFDGRSWKSDKDGEDIDRGPGAFGNASGAGDAGKAIQQTIFLEPYGKEYLFALDRPAHVAAKNVRRLAGMTFASRDEIFNTIRYTAISVMSPVLPEQLEDNDTYLALPAGFAPRIRKLAESMSDGKDTALAAETFFRFLRDGDFKYSLEGLPVNDNALEEFVLDHRRGNCEYFASALAVMLRMTGIPARLVGGYRGGYYNEAGRYYLLLQNNAHVWVEAHVRDIGWVRLDPTPPLPMNASLQMDSSFLIRLRVFLDTFNYYWNKLIIEYDFRSQIALFKKIRSTLAKPGLHLNVDRERAARGLGVAAAVMLAAFGLYQAYRYRKRRTNVLIAAFFSRMNRRGYKRERNEGLEEFAARIEDGELREKASRFVLEFESVYYKDGEFSRETVRRLEQSIADL